MHIHTISITHTMQATGKAHEDPKDTCMFACIYMCKCTAYTYVSMCVYGLGFNTFGFWFNAQMVLVFRVYMYMCWYLYTYMCNYKVYMLKKITIRVYCICEQVSRMILALRNSFIKIYCMCEHVFYVCICINVYVYVFMFL